MIDDSWMIPWFWIGFVALYVTLVINSIYWSIVVLFVVLFVPFYYRIMVPLRRIMEIEESKLNAPDGD